MKKIILAIAFISINSHATDLISLYERAKIHNIEILDNELDVNIANESLKQTRSTVFPDIIFNAGHQGLQLSAINHWVYIIPLTTIEILITLTVRQTLLHLLCI